jgi:hypothetical protein
MVKTRLSTVPEILEHLNLKIAETERSYELIGGFTDTGNRLRAELEVMKYFRDMIIC